MFNYKAVVITKVDETAEIDSVISILAAMKKSLAFITTGPKIPSDIERASLDVLLKHSLQKESGAKDE